MTVRNRVALVAVIGALCGLLAGPLIAHAQGVSFQKNDEAPLFIPYAIPPFNIDPALDEISNPTKPTGSSFKALDVVALAPACAEQPTGADIMALFDNVVVLPLVP